MAPTARDVMTTEVLTVNPTTPLTEFARMCAEDHISGAPVVQVDGRLVGIVTKTDLIERLLADDPRYGTSEEPSTWDDNLRQVDDIMQTNVLTVAPEASLPEMAERMASGRVHRVLVTEAEKLVGIITSIDLLAYFPGD